MNADWEPVIGIETHVELATASKMFCGCPVTFGAPPNTAVCPTCLGLPGALPVPNRRAIESIIAIGLALECQVAPSSVFHRKNYFYADLPKNYQISQYDLPVCVGGGLEFILEGERVLVGIERAHMEEDTGKTIHRGGGGRLHSSSASLLDFNRSGVPLVEIVSRPDLRSPEQARAYAQELRAVVAALGVSDAKLEEGSIRFDANVSVRPVGSSPLGVKVEIKNMNSFRSLERAVASEIRRQIDLLEGGGTVVQETRHWDEEAGVTHGMRVKEGSSDYRYFTEPDLVPMVVDEDWRLAIAATLPELPAARRSRYLGLGVEQQVVGSLLSAEQSLVDLFEAGLTAGADPRQAANWVSGEVVAWLRRQDLPPASGNLTGQHLAELSNMVDEGLVSASAAKDVLAGVLAGEGGPAEVAGRRDLLQISDRGALQTAVDEVLAVNPDAVVRLASGDQKPFGFLVGQVMKSTGGKADPKLVTEMLRSRLGSAP
jgi:aspartyl-tRNA(Asn)/glutamyl-tRNA(Gln) amidotransferase subunit B